MVSWPHFWLHQPKNGGQPNQNFGKSNQIAIWLFQTSQKRLQNFYECKKFFKRITKEISLRIAPFFKNKKLPPSINTNGKFDQGIKNGVQTVKTYLYPLQSRYFKLWTTALTIKTLNIDAKNHFFLKKKPALPTRVR